MTQTIAEQTDKSIYDFAEHYEGKKRVLCVYFLTLSVERIKKQRCLRSSEHASWPDLDSSIPFFNKKELEILGETALSRAQELE